MFTETTPRALKKQNGMTIAPRKERGEQNTYNPEESIEKFQTKEV